MSSSSELGKRCSRGWTTSDKATICDRSFRKSIKDSSAEATSGLIWEEHRCIDWQASIATRKRLSDGSIVWKQCQSATYYRSNAFTNSSAIVEILNDGSVETKKSVQFQLFLYRTAILVVLKQYHSSTLHGDHQCIIVRHQNNKIAEPAICFIAPSP